MEELEQVLHEYGFRGTPMSHSLWSIFYFESFRKLLSSPKSLFCRVCTLSWPTTGIGLQFTIKRGRGSPPCHMVRALEIVLIWRRSCKSL